MNKANECTCPSGDGSLVHPCPAHPAVEQVGGDERAAFEAAFAAMGRPVCRADYDQDAYGTPFDDGGWTGWQARAALAQPSPEPVAYTTAGMLEILKASEGQCSLGAKKQADHRWNVPLFTRKPSDCATCGGRGSVCVDWEAGAWSDCPDCAQPSPAPELERPEVVGTLLINKHYDGSKSVDATRSWYTEGLDIGVHHLMTVAQHDRIVGALRAENAKLSEALDECDGDRWKLRSERDAANARLHEVATACATAEQERDSALAGVAELERQEPVATVAKVPGEDWNSLDFHRDLQEMQPGTKLYAAPVAQAQQLNDLDKQCRDDVARALGLRPNQERGFAWSYLLASIKSCVKASGDSAQAQHSVPDGAADLCRFLAKLYCELDGLRYSTAKLPAEQIADALIFKWPVLQGARNQLNIKRISEQPYDESKLHSAIAAMLAAAPGKEVPQAWLDVQAERRRQIEAEGWTPEHDDEHADGQMAQAAGCYALHAGGIGTDWPDGRQNGAALFWPWDRDSWKPTTPRRDLVKACALALAEIERLDRATATQGGPRDA